MNRLFAEADVSIDAPAEVVWTVMLDLAHYPLWNPFIVRVDAPGGRGPRVGDAITLHVRFRGGRAVASRERITRIEPPAVGGGVTKALLEYEFAGRLHRTGLVRGRRVQRLEQGPDGATRYHTEEMFRGALAFVLPVRAIRSGFRRHARALKARAESIDVPGIPSQFDPRSGRAATSVAEDSHLELAQAAVPDLPEGGYGDLVRDQIGSVRDRIHPQEHR